MEIRHVPFFDIPRAIKTFTKKALEESNKVSHWERVYQTKSPREVSWTQEEPQPSLGLIIDSGIAKDAPVIDVGGGDSRLVDRLLDLGFTDLTVLDISAHALERCKERLGDRAGQVAWIVSDINDFQPERSYALWHDRAAFHFLTEADHIARYAAMVAANVSDRLIIGTFSTKGPKRCSGLDITQYDEPSMKAVFEPAFEVLRFLPHTHTTPFDTTQDFIFAEMKKGGV